VNEVTDILNYIFTGVFALEALFKIIAFGGGYFSDNWNLFDFIIVIGSFAGFFLNNVNSSINIGPQATIIRSFRILRIFRLFRKNKSLKIISQTFIITLPAMMNVGGLLMLFLYMYSIMGVFLFAEVKLTGTLNEHINFQNVGIAFITLLRVATGENWHDVVASHSFKAHIWYQCIEDPSYEDYL